MHYKKNDILHSEVVFKSVKICRKTHLFTFYINWLKCTICTERFAPNTTDKEGGMKHWYPLIHPFTINRRGRRIHGACLDLTGANAGLDLLFISLHHYHLWKYWRDVKMMKWQKLNNTNKWGSSKIATAKCSLSKNQATLDRSFETRNNTTGRRLKSQHFQKK